MNGYVPIDRGSSSRKKDQLKTGVKYLKRGRSVMMYPEGTRSPDHRFRSFKKGTFVLAIRAGVPVLPVVVSGSGRLWPKPSLLIRPGKVRVEVLPPVSTDGLRVEDRDRLLATVRDAMVPRYRTSADAAPLGEQPALLQALAPR
jgi:1-acyl-sn-glycerol-3-phosphate acyltransferase